MRNGLTEDGICYTLEEVGREFGVTRERIRQIEAKALERIRFHERAKQLFTVLSKQNGPTTGPFCFVVPRNYLWFYDVPNLAHTLSRGVARFLIEIVEVERHAIVRDLGGAVGTGDRAHGARRIGRCHDLRISGLHQRWPLFGARTVAGRCSDAVLCEEIERHTVCIGEECAELCGGTSRERNGLHLLLRRRGTLRIVGRGRGRGRAHRREPVPSAGNDNENYYDPNNDCRRFHKTKIRLLLLI
jgi:hypothetical protein